MFKFVSVFSTAGVIAMLLVLPLAGYPLLVLNLMFIACMPFFNYIYYNWILALDWKDEGGTDWSLIVDIVFSATQLIWLPLAAIFASLTYGRGILCNITGLWCPAAAAY